MAVSNVQDYLLVVENDKAEALRIAERTAQSASKYHFSLDIDILTHAQSYNHGNGLF